MYYSKKIISRDTIASFCATQKAEGRKIVFTNGCFDLLHAGHVDLLEKARELGDILILGLNSDDSVRRLKGANRPIVPEEDRARVLLGLWSVDYVTIFDEDTPFELIRLVRPDVLVKGGDYTPDTIVGRDTVESYGGKVAVIPLLKGKSSTDIIRSIQRL